MTPFAIGVVVFVLAPLVVTAVYAFTEYDALSPPRWVGLRNFSRLADDREFRASLRATGWFLLLVIPVRVVASVGLALLMHKRERLAATGRVAVFLPSVLPDVAAAAVWVWLINPLYGPCAAILRMFGFTPGPTLLDPWGARAVIGTLIVFALGEGFLVSLAARRELPSALYDVARAEGAGGLATLRRVTLPLMRPVLGLLVARDILAALQASVVPTILLTDGGPSFSTLTLPVLIYERGFQELRLGSAAALSLLLFAGSTACAVAALVATRQWSTVPEG
jgi:multiple sugar transport system permease protein